MTLSNWERDVFLSLQGSHIEAVNKLMVFASSSIPWIPLTLLLLFFVYKKLSTRNFLIVFCYLILLLAMTDSTTSYLFKNLFTRLRPCHMEELKSVMINFGQWCGGKFGFFSSHASNSMALACFLIYFSKISLPLKSIIFVYVGIIGYSRIHLGVHLPLDILTGYVWGLCLASLWIHIAKNSFTEPNGA